MLRYNLLDRTNTVKAGCFKVDVFELSSQWLYMARRTVNHPHIAYVKAFLIPSLGLQINRWQLHEGASNDYSFYDYYVDIGSIETNKNEWVLRDFYLDVLVVERQGAHILDTDEYLQGLQAKLLTPEEAYVALETTHHLINGLAKQHYNLESYLRDQDINIDLGKLR
jgi:uncharacterized protein